MGCGRARGKPAYRTAVGIFTSPDGVGEARRKSSLRHCGRIFLNISREEKRMQAQEKNIDSGKTSNQHPHTSLAHHELNSVSRSNFK